MNLLLMRVPEKAGPNEVFPPVFCFTEGGIYK